jgi:hypothetical protein
VMSSEGFAAEVYERGACDEHHFSSKHFVVVLSSNIPHPHAQLNSSDEDQVSGLGVCRIHISMW